ncbi:hypothetical protein A6A25_01485 [Saccharothrix sp. CB00851]|nr:BTAD domain-containing putative transcriptional regulator [Saccharothrix sp. CB00851]OKI38902.1 hypothetical protein A6A25_01485 [Saccharothrix sp. CB00851]
MTVVGKTTTRFNVLGPLEVWHGDVLVPIPAGRSRLLLAILLLRANQPVSADELVDRLWDGEAPNPDRAKATLQMVVRRLRQSLGPAKVVRTAVGGYVADVPPGALDLHRFRELAAAGKYAEALELWRGEPLRDVRSDVLHQVEVAPLLEEYLVVLERRIDADLDAGRAGDLVAELRSLTGQHPLRERFWGQLMLALYRSDQQAAALAAFRAVRATLVEELGVDPGPMLTDLYHRILRDDVPGGSVVMPSRQALRHVPPEVSLFVGRERELAALDEATLEPGAVVLLHGIGGVGKTALALSWANRRRDRFGDGDLHVNLHGFDAAGRPVEPASAAEALLVSLGVRPEDVPAGLAERTTLLRATMAGRRILLVLDNAADSDQVIPLLPGTPTVTVLVTSRNQLRKLAAHQRVTCAAPRSTTSAGSTRRSTGTTRRSKPSSGGWRSRCTSAIGGWRASSSRTSAACTSGLDSTPSPSSTIPARWRSRRSRTMTTGRRRRTSTSRSACSASTGTRRRRSTVGERARSSRAMATTTTPRGLSASSRRRRGRWAGSPKRSRCCVRGSRP